MKYIRIIFNRIPYGMSDFFFYFYILPYRHKVWEHIHQINNDVIKDIIPKYTMKLCKIFYVNYINDIHFHKFQSMIFFKQ